MPVTSPDEIFFADNTTPASLATITNTMALSVQAALDLRESYTFRWDNDAARDDQAGMQVGDIGYQLDNATFYKWTGSAWKIWMREPTAYTPTLSAGITASSMSFVYAITGDVCTVSGRIVVTDVTASFTVSVPTEAPIHAYAYASGSRFNSLGSGSAYDTSAGTSYLLMPAALSSTAVTPKRVDSSATSATINSVGATTPFDWAAGDVIDLQFTYPIA
jgi:hypothetical protein